MPKILGVNHVDAVRALEKADFRIERQSKHIVMTDGARIVTILRENPVSSFTMGGDRQGCRLDAGGVPEATVNRRRNKRLELTRLGQARCSGSSAGPRPASRRCYQEIAVQRNHNVGHRCPHITRP